MTKEDKMDRIDLTELAARGRTLSEAVNEYVEALDEGYTAALGEHDPETDEAIVEPTGDIPELFEQAKKKAAEARFALSQTIDTLATLQGYREFEEQGVDVG